LPQNLLTVNISGKLIPVHTNVLFVIGTTI
jgi:hypothetical protein